MDNTNEFTFEDSELFNESVVNAIEEFYEADYYHADRIDPADLHEFIKSNLKIVGERQNFPE